MILHLGLGHFHRGHQAVYYQKTHDKVISLSMRSSEARDKLRKVNLRYPVVELSADASEVTWINCIQDALSATEDFKRIMECFVMSDLEIITLTITEKGYDLNAQGELDLLKPGITHDLKNPNTPTSAMGILALGLKQRRLAGKNPLTVMSCENLRDNGHKLGNALKKYLATLKWDKDLLWITEKIKFPNTMVDRIVPTLLPEKVLSLEKEFNLPEGSELIGTEKFSQWVIEDNFALTRPNWDAVGVQFVKNVRPFEEMKLKLLNASHSYLAYAGLNRGFQFVHEAIQDKELRENVLRLYQEVTPLLEIPVGFDLSQYKIDLVKRFENNKLPHQLKQIAMDGSQKLPQRIFPSLTSAETRNLPHEVLTIVVKEWFKYCLFVLEKNKLPDDPESTDMKSSFRTWRDQFLAGQKISEQLTTRIISK
jgi:fructuronate reductase